MNVLKEMKCGLRVVGRLEAQRNGFTEVLVVDDPATDDLLFTCGAEIQRITKSEMLDAVANDTGAHLANKVREIVRGLTDMWPTEAGA